MVIRFKKKIQGFTYLSPLNNFQPFEGKIETRWDPLTNLTSRIIHFPKKKLENQGLEIFTKMAPSETCPFCPQNIETMTSKFAIDLFGQERIKEGGITVIPNLLTFDKYCMVAIISHEHFLDMTQIAEKGSVISGIKVLISVLKKILEKDRKVKYISINSNYMPMSGSSILHPHVQAIAGEVGTNYHRLIIQRSSDFFKRYGKVYWEALIDKESGIGERFIGKIGNTFWYTPYAPKGNMDIGCIFDKASILDIEEKDLNDFQDGFKRVINYFVRENVPGYNLSLFSGVPGKDRSFRVNLRILGRRFLPPVGASDTNYFHTLHMESTSIFSPEEVAEGIRLYNMEKDYEKRIIS